MSSDVSGRRLLSYLRPYRSQFLLALFAMIIYGASDGLLPILIKTVLDEIFGAHNKSLLYLIPPALLVFAIVRAAAGFVQQYLSASIGLRIVRDLRNQLNAQLLRLSDGFFTQQVTGALMSRVTNDTLLVRMALTDSVSSLLRDSVRVLALLGAAMYLDPVLGLIAFVGVPVGIIPVMRFGKRVRKLSKVGQETFGGLAAVLQETIVGHRVVQAFSMEQHEQERFAQENNKLTDTLIKAEKYGALSQPTNEIIGTMAVALIILYGGLSVISGVRTQGDFIAFILSLFLLYEPVKKLGKVNATVQTALAAAERIFEVLDLQPDIQDAADARPLPAGALKIEYADVSFAYQSRSSLGGTLLSGGPLSASLPVAPELSDATPVALQGVSFVVEAGTTCAFVGPSGSGKSTIVSLLPRFYDPQRGLITIGGVDIRSATLASLRERVAIVSQHTFLFNDTVFNNIAYGRKGATQAEVVAAAVAAGAHTFISQLPSGYDTQIGEQGFTLSGGERQRVAIARALLKNAPILILDEATASLDNQSERLVQQALDELMKGRTVLVIAHRLSTVRNASQICVVSHGHIVERGSHDDLLARNGEYARLYRLQYQGDDREEARRVAHA